MSGSSLQKQGERHDPGTLAERVKSGEIREISRLITLVENRDPTGWLILERLDAVARKAMVIGITGYPGAGKSTVIDRLVTAYRGQGKKVGVIAVDATSPLTGGALLGDRIRMQDHACDSGVFIRSLATRGFHGGIARSTSDIVQVLEAAGYDVILVETVGVGQEEVAIAALVQTVVVVVTPGLGDEVQAMKAGVLEVAHIVVLNKGDHEGADAAVTDLIGWVNQVVRTVAIKGDGIPDLVEAIARHQQGIERKATLVEG